MLKKTCAMVFLASLVTFTPAISNAASPNPKSAVEAPVPPEPHPHIRTALRELREARKELETAAHDFGGHKKEAIEAVDNAIRQLEEALKYDKK